VPDIILLREYAESDLERLTHLANNGNVSRYLVYTFPSVHFTGCRMVDRNRFKIERRAIEYQGVFLGNIGIRPQAGWCDLSVRLAIKLVKIIGARASPRRALSQMTEYGFNTLNLRKLYATALAPKFASMRVLEKCGYEREAKLMNEVQKGGRHFSIHQFARYR
jgi:ribosomal-protein-alanine N-acetyltransferase